MDLESSDRDDLHFWSFVDFAVAKSSGQLPDIDPLAMRMVMTLHRAANMIVYDLESSVHRPRGWSWPGFRVLFAVWLTAPVEARKVAQVTGMSRAAVSALVSTLQRDGLLVKDRAPHDARALHLRLTESGLEAITEAFRAHNSREQEWAGALSAEEQHMVVRLLEKLAAHSTQFEARHRA